MGIGRGHLILFFFFKLSVPDEEITYKNWPKFSDPPKNDLSTYDTVQEDYRCIARAPTGVRSQCSGRRRPPQMALLSTWNWFKLVSNKRGIIDPGFDGCYYSKSWDATCLYRPAFLGLIIVFNSLCRCILSVGIIFAEYSWILIKLQTHGETVGASL